MEIFSVFRMLHIIGGFTALLVFWVPMITKKGGKIHNFIGWVYVWAMAIVSISAFYMGIYRVLFDENANTERISFSWFLIFIAILSGASAWYGIRVLCFKKRTKAHRNIIDIFVSILLLTSGMAIGIYGVMIKSPLITYFPLLGLFLGSIQLNYWLRKPVKRMHWLFEHFGGMISCCISTVTAFATFGAPRLLNIQSSNLLLWLLPTFILVPVLIGFSMFYGKKYSGKKQAGIRSEKM
ncbi:DUF2306 domain-containing protein [Bacillus sp. FJAT-29790]|uniref:DUF2306 domain-containing protein n=1 Tax=Bacillus sp. FJAT-29790 TaxID=1895002 RepID=UPI001C248CD8|nr:DUF2306 domain-containing protein [Bacillus sp. FJAT-29790]MBU8880569.1 DUF2306 domain-containing protein [Bacillus sp. FJAT-29790]